MIHIDEDRCPQNHACPAVAACPFEALVQDDIHSAPRVLAGRCTDCGICTQACGVFTHIGDEVEVA
jgi:heterodisulfide reductase subunit A-like polyferredoxin